MTAFARKVKPKILQPQPHDQRSNKIIIKEWFIRWDKTMAVVTAIVIFFTLLVLVIFRLKSTSSTQEPNEKSFGVIMKNFDSSIIIKNILSTEKGLESTAGCFHISDHIECTRVDAGQLCEKINKLLDEGKSKVDELQLIDVTYNNYTINNGWLNCVTQSFTKLTISGTTLLHLGDGAFSGFPFETGIETLTINSTEITTYRKGSFTGARIDTLQIYDGNLVTLEESVFAEIATSLEILMMQRVIYLSESLINATGSKATPLYRLRLLDLQYNTLGILTSDSFTSVSSVTNLYLSSSKITAIEAAAFKDMRLEILDLRNNYLVTIPEHVFDSVKSGITIIRNVWRCDCDLVWFRDYYNKSTSENGGNLFQDAFLCNNTIDYSEVDFCPNNRSTTVLPPPTSKSTERTTTTSTTFPTKTTTFPTTTTTFPTTTTHDDSPTGLTTLPTDATATEVPTEPTSLAPTSPPTTSTSTEAGTTTTSTAAPSPAPTPPPNDNSVKVDCYDTSTDLEAVDYSFQAWIRKGDVNISVSSSTESKHIVHIDGAIGSEDLLIWFNVKNKDTIYCSYNLRPQKPLSLGQLPPNETYTLCLLQNGTKTVSAFDCMGYTTPLQWDDRAWIPNKSMSIVIGAICASLLAAVLISGLIVFYCIRQHPSLIKGNKRVIMVESQAADAIVMPKYYDRIDYIPPSFVSSSQGYLTPVNRVRRRSVVQTVSRNSSMMGVPPPRIGRYRRRSRVRLEQVSQNFDEHLYEPPPLPPNHPSEWIYNSSIDSYSRV